MIVPQKSITILLAEDDLDDCMLTRDALIQSGVSHELRIVYDGEELLDYLFRHGKYCVPGAAPRPSVILLDLNMPRMDGREALGLIKAHSELRRIPIVILTTSHNEADIFRSYDLGAGSYINKPVSFTAMVDLMRDLGRYWVDIVRLPGEREEPGWSAR